MVTKVTIGRGARACALRRGGWLLALALTLAACDFDPFFFLGEVGDPPLSGQRIPVLLGADKAEADPRIADLAIRLPRPFRNLTWPQQGGFANHAMHHLDLVAVPNRHWSADVGSASVSDEPVLSGPIIADERVYAMDADAAIGAWRTDNGALIWRTEIQPDGEGDGNWGGGLAFDNGRVFAGTGFAQVVALNANNGEVLWRADVSAPVRAAPTAFAGRVYAVTRDNQLFALDGNSGAVLWSHTGIEEAAGLLGSASPAIEGNVVVVAYSSGELFALRAENGRQLWSDNLAAIRRVDAVSALADIRGRPVIDRGRVFAVSHSGRMVAIDLATGRRIWEAAIGGEDQPWIAGDFIFVLTRDGEVAALTVKDGRVRWVTRIGLYEDPEDRDDRIEWSGPVLAGDRLIVSGSHGEAVALSPYTGDVIGKQDMPSGVSLAPAVANRALYFLTDEAELVVFN